MRCQKNRRIEPPLTFSTASGERVEIRREVVLKMSISGEHGLQRPLLVRCLVSHVEHNLLSVYGVCKQGWRFSMGPETCECAIGSIRVYPTIWANCPWLKADEYVEPDPDSTVVRKPKLGKGPGKSPGKYPVPEQYHPDHHQPERSSGSMDIDACVATSGAQSPKKQKGKSFPKSVLKR